VLPVQPTMKEKFVPRKDIPRIGWVLVDAVDNWTADFACQNCKFPHVRYVHELKHKNTGTIISVGCVCVSTSRARLRYSSTAGKSVKKLGWSPDALADSQLEAFLQRKFVPKETRHGDCSQTVRWKMGGELQTCR